MRHLLGGMLAQDEVITLVDTEAGLEHLSRGTARHVNVLLVVLEPYFKALETARRCAELGRELGIARVAGVANKWRGEDDRLAVRRYAEAHGLELVGEVPFDPAVQAADLTGGPPELMPDGPAARAIAALIDALGIEQRKRADLA